jgi:hypothetical protein
MKKWLALAALLLPMVGQAQMQVTPGSGKTVLVNKAGKVMGDLVFGFLGSTFLVVNIKNNSYGVLLTPSMSELGEPTFNVSGQTVYWSETGCTGAMFLVTGDPAAGSYLGLNRSEIFYVASTDRYELVVSEYRKPELVMVRSIESPGSCYEYEGGLENYFYRVTKRIPWSTSEFSPRWVPGLPKAARN